VPYLIVILILLALLFGPQWWAQYTFRRYAKPLERIPGSGAELARHLLDRFEMQTVSVEKTEIDNDHYDPQSRSVRLGPDNHDQNSLTALAVAAHEVGHAIQHHRGEALLSLRTRLIQVASVAQKIGAAALVVMPIAALVTRVPSIGLMLLITGVGSMFIASLVHLVTLPVELDASFNKALPILREGYVSKDDEPKVRRVLRAAAITYLAGSLASLLNLWRWIAILRR
jgi:Zn-dependent membrane protease YugP